MVPQGAARVIQLSFGFAIIMLLANTLSAEVLGRYYVVTGVSVLIHIVLFNGLHFPIQRMLPSGRSEQSSFVSTLVFTSHAAFCLLLAGYLLALETASQPVAIAFMVALLAISETIESQITNLTSALRSPWVYLFSVCTRSSVILGSIIAFAAIDALTVERVIACFAAGNIAMSVIAAKRLQPLLQFRAIDFSLVRASTRFSAPYMLSEAMNQSVLRLDRAIVAYFLGWAAAGTYGLIADLCRRLIEGVTIGARLAYVRDVVEAEISGDRAEREVAILKLSRAFLLIGTTIASCLAAYGNQAFSLAIGNPEFTRYPGLIQILALTYLLAAARKYVIQLPFELTGRRWLDTVVSLVAFISFLLLFPGLTHMMGIMGSGAGMLIVNIIGTICAGVLNVRHCRVGLPHREIAVSFLCPVAATIWARSGMSGTSVDIISTGVGLVVSGSIVVIFHIALFWTSDRNKR
jgi:O-antigen/teichoic acid export membrane protein